VLLIVCIANDQTIKRSSDIAAPRTCQLSTKKAFPRSRVQLVNHRAPPIYPTRLARHRGYRLDHLVLLMNVIPCVPASPIVRCSGAARRAQLGLSVDSDAPFSMRTLAACSLASTETLGLCRVLESVSEAGHAAERHQTRRVWMREENDKE
jgi:hypothetical protein